MDFRVRCTHNKGDDCNVGEFYMIKDRGIYNMSGDYISSFGHEATKEGLQEYNDAQWDRAACKMSRFELVEDNMRKEDLKVGYVTKNRSGKYEMVVPSEYGDALVGGGCDGYLSGFKEDLTYNGSGREFDIIEVYGYADTSRYAMTISVDGRKLLWERKPEITEVTMQEIANWKGVLVESVRVKE